ncbi:MAG TPA: hypothetical protein VLT35_05040 [Methanocella sp.]|nr:hypothetical protein [Methanocella sp.]
MVDTTVGKADSMKVQTADALAELARKLREADLSGKGDDIKAALTDAEARLNAMSKEIGEKVEPAETFIIEHPFTSVLIAAGVGFMIGSMMSMMRPRD